MSGNYKQIASQNVDTVNINLRTINGAAFVPPVAPGIIAAGDIPVGSGVPSPLFVDSGVNISGIGAVTGASSISTAGGAKLEAIPVLGDIGNALDLDTITGFPGNQVVFHDDTLSTMGLVAGASLTKDANLLVANRSVNPARTTTFASANGAVTVSAGTSSSVVGGTQVQLTQTANGHGLAMNAGGVVLSSGGGAPLSISGITSATMSAQTVASINAIGSISLNETTDANTVLMDGGGIALASGTAKPISMSTAGAVSANGVSFSATQDITRVTSITLTDGANTVTFSRTAGGAPYPIAWPAAQGAAGQTIRNDGAGNLTWGV